MPRTYKYEKIIMDAYDPDGVELENILRLIDFKRHDRVLEVGTGDGRVAFKIAPYVKEVYGIDIDKERLKIAKARSLDNMLMIYGDAEKAPFGNGFFDVVLCPWVLHHVKDKEAVLLEIHRTLKKMGAFLSIDVASNADCIYLKGRINPEIPNFVKKRTKKILGMIKGSGLEIITTKRLHTYYLLPTIKEVHMFFKEFDIPYKKLDENFLYKYLEERKTKGGYKIYESAYLTLARKR